MDVPVRVGGNVRPPNKIKDIAPVYPDEARAAGVQGVVILEITIDVNGRVSEARVLRSLPMADQAALDAVKQWEFEPTVLGDKTVPVKMVATVNFGLDGARRGRGGMAAVGHQGMIGAAGTGWFGATNGSMTTFNNGMTEERYNFNSERFAKLPTWDPVRVPEPPVSIGAAVAAAEARMQQRHPELNQFEVMSVTLRRMGPTWMYHVGIMPLQQGRPMPAQGGPVIVLMDGTVLEPEPVETR
jgi:TonB family protein